VPAVRAIVGILFAALFAACARALPDDPLPRALVRDVARVVDVRSGVGWFVDESEMLTTLPDVMKSACQVTPEDRALALGWLDGQVGLEGGDVVARWRERGKSLGAVSELLRLTRMRLLLRRADEWARLGRCPFWLEPSPAFRGVHTQGDRFVLTLEGGGRAIQESVPGGSVKYGGGGSGRLLIGYGFGENWALLVGADVGGVARFTNLQLGQQSDLPDLVGLGVVPAVLRWSFGLSAYGELELGPMAYFDKGKLQDPVTGRVEAHWDNGYHLGLAVGATYLRLQRGIIPKFAFAVTVDRVPGVNGTPGLIQIGFGARTGIDLSRWHGF
jgi:hypothetical protein